MNWTQPVCYACYSEKEPGREGSRLKPEYVKTERCCFCGESTREGIYYRVDPRTVPYPSPEDD